MSFSFGGDLALSEGICEKLPIIANNHKLFTQIILTKLNRSGTFI